MTKYAVFFFIALTMNSPSLWANHCINLTLWQQFKEQFLTEDGRVIDHQNQLKISTSEGQAYALFFALVAKDKQSFQLILDWTNNNLADGHLASQLPAWKWGLNSSTGQWTVLDRNSAADADVWLSYALQEAGRLWNNRHYSTLGKQVAQLILHKETVYLPRLGLTLLPAPYGFHPRKDIWRLNPSYLTIPLFQYFALSDERWKALVNSSFQVISQSLINGLAPDWTQYTLDHGVQLDKQTQGIGSYDAIRVYLWAGMIHPQDKRKKALLTRLKPMQQLIETLGYPPTTVNHPQHGHYDESSLGFSAAMLPFLSASNSSKGLINQLSRLLQEQHNNQRNYYSQVLRIFGLGWYYKQFRFDANGRLLLADEQSCKS